VRYSYHWKNICSKYIHSNTVFWHDVFGCTILSWSWSPCAITDGWHARSLLSIQENWLSNGHGHQSPLFRSVVPTVASNPTFHKNIEEVRWSTVLDSYCDRQGTTDLWMTRIGQCCGFILQLRHIRNCCVFPLFLVQIASAEISFEWMCFPTYLRFDDGWYLPYGRFVLTPSVPGTVAILLTWWGEKVS